MTKKFKLEFECENMAFESDQLKPQIAYVLTVLASVMTDGFNDEDSGVVCDVNGNVVGKWSIGEEEPEPWNDN